MSCTSAVLRQRRVPPAMSATSSTGITWAARLESAVDIRSSMPGTRHKQLKLPGGTAAVEQQDVTVNFHM
ncbi:hypothetical protein [Sedimenticola selenatireducens]|uniref:hypothetical protein n=1 Tax=Sedimenticola selenatireducens TaxID=191960 RepID=UPI00056AEFE2|nr:hypothetical protein [Sedimenticola selenatireducens]